MIEYLLMLFARRSPMYLLCLGGIIFAIVRWKRTPRASLMTVVGLAIYVIEGVLFSVFLYWLPNLIANLHLTGKGRNNFYMVLFFCEDFVFAGVIILLVAAAFIGRGAQAQAETPHPPSNFEK